MRIHNKYATIINNVLSKGNKSLRLDLRSYIRVILDNNIILDLKYYGIALNCIYLLLKRVFLLNGTIGLINFVEEFCSPHAQDLGKYLDHINIYNLYRGGFFTSNIYLTSNESSDILYTIFGTI